jgi:hypothetical protein
MDRRNLRIKLINFREIRANRHRENCTVLASQNEITFRRVLSHLKIF